MIILLIIFFALGLAAAGLTMYSVHLSKIMNGFELLTMDTAKGKEIIDKYPKWQMIGKISTLVILVSVIVVAFALFKILSKLMAAVKEKRKNAVNAMIPAAAAAGGYVQSGAAVNAYNEQYQQMNVQPQQTYPQGYVQPQQTYPQTYVQPQQGYAQTYAQPQQTYQQNYVEPQQTYQQNYVEPQQTYQQNYVEPQQGYAQTYVQPQQTYPQGYVQPQQGYAQGYAQPQQMYPQGYVQPQQEYQQEYPQNGGQ